MGWPRQVASRGQPISSRKRRFHTTSRSCGSEKGDALVDVVDRFVQPGPGWIPRSGSPLAQQRSQIAWRPGGARHQGGGLFLPDLQQRGHAKLHDPASGRTTSSGPAMAAGPAARRSMPMLMPSRTVVDCRASSALTRYSSISAARNALRYQVDAAQALALAGRYDTPFGIHEVVHQAQLCVQQVAKLLGKGVKGTGGAKVLAAGCHSRARLTNQQTVAAVGFTAPPVPLQSLALRRNCSCFMPLSLSMTTRVVVSERTIFVPSDVQEGRVELHDGPAHSLLSPSS